MSKKIKWEQRLEAPAVSRRLSRGASTTPIERPSRTQVRTRTTPRGLRQTYRGNHERRDIDQWLFPAPTARLRAKS